MTIDFEESTIPMLWRNHSFITFEELLYEKKHDDAPTTDDPR